MDISGPFLQFKNENLQIALELRKQGCLKEARVYLDKACKEDQDGEAFFFKWDMYINGGCGVKKNEQLAFVYAQRAARHGIYWGLLDEKSTSLSPIDTLGKAICNLNNIDMEEEGLCLLVEAIQQGQWYAVSFCTDICVKTILPALEFAASLGHSSAYRFLVRHDFDKYFGYCLKGAKAREYTCLCCLSQHYRRNEDYIQLAKCILRNSDYGLMRIRLSADDFEDESLRKQELYIFGRKFFIAKVESWLNIFLYNGLAKQAIEIYTESWARAHNATVTFLLCCKKWGIYKDVTEINGKLIWESRTNPILWEKAEEKNKKIKFV